MEFTHLLNTVYSKVEAKHLIGSFGHASPKFPELNSDQRFVLTHIFRPMSYAGSTMRHLDTAATAWSTQKRKLTFPEQET